MAFSALLGSMWRVAGGLILMSGVVAIVLAPIIGKSTFEQLWVVKPLTYIGAILVIAGLATVTASYLVRGLTSGARRNNGADNAMRQWSEVTQQYFELFQHDLGRPFTRIVARERELRALLANAEELDKSAVWELLDEIERQSPNFRLMLSNIQVLVHLEAPDPVTEPRPVEPPEVVRRIVDRYAPVAAEGNKDITWWSEPEQFGIVYSDTSAIEHIATNLIDNAVRFATEHIEVKLTKNQTHFFVRVWDDGTGIAPQHRAHVFDRGWTPESARRDERKSSGLGLHTAGTPARRWGGDIAVDSLAAPSPGHYTAVTASLRSGPAP